MYGISSIRSYVVKRRPHLRHSRRRRMVSPLRPSRESITLSSTCAQKGHFTRQFLLERFHALGHLPQFADRPAFANEQRHTREAAHGEGDEPQNNGGGNGRLSFYSKDCRVRNDGSSLRPAADSGHLDSGAHQGESHNQHGVTYADGGEPTAET